MAGNIYDALRESHELQRSLCRKLLRAAPSSERRQQIFRELRIELAAHAAAEERFLYAPMLMDDMGLNPSRHALAEHHEIDECVESLAEADEQGGSWLAKARQLSHEVHHHLKEEESKFFQISGKILTETQKERLAQRYLKDFARMKKVFAESL
ncbi:MAG: hemerythrin domain-containing protein [Pigmentiphaga sp.]|nr:hemerythrin domain-containing protein [Pigmentiphaga sp.]